MPTYAAPAGSLALLALLAGCASRPAPRPPDDTGLAAVRSQTVAVPERAVETVAWQGVMACGARVDDGPNAAAYEAHFAVDVRGRAVHAHRRTAEVEETLAGEVQNDRLELRGIGNSISDTRRRWRLDVSGTFPPGATSYVGKGSMLLGGQAIRACELRMTRA
jgi:hypothetical protein